MKALTEEEKYMREAVREAKKALKRGEVPIGCVIVMNGEIIARGYNRRMTDKSAIAHAEMYAIKKACKVTGDWRLDGAEMYVTLEPCQMCSGAIIQARIRKLYIGAMNPKAGFAGSLMNIFEVPGLNHRVEIETGIMAGECAALLTQFFKDLRKKSS